MASKESLTEEIVNALAQMGTSAAGGAAKMQSFGLYDPTKNLSAFDDGSVNNYIGRAMKNSPISEKVGEYAPLFFDAPEMLGGKYIKKILPQNWVNAGASAIGHGVEAGAEKVVPGFIAKLLKHGAAGATQAAAQGAVRQAAGTEPPEDFKDYLKNVGYSGLLSAAVGAPAESILSKAAPVVYAHDDLINKNVPTGRPKDLINELMKRGEWGTNEHFQDVADAAKAKYVGVKDPSGENRGGVINDLMDRLKMKEAAGQFKVNPEETMQGLDEAHYNADQVPGDKLSDALAEARRKVLFNLGDNPKLSNLNDLHKIYNQSASKIPDKGLAAILGRAIGGPAQAEQEATFAAKRSMDAYKDKIISQNLEDTVNPENSGSALLAAGKKEYGFGANLDKALNKRSSLDDIGDTSDAGVAAKLALSVGGPKRALFNGAKSLLGPTWARTGAGIAMQDAAPEVGNFVGRVSEANTANPRQKKSRFSAPSGTGGTFDDILNESSDQAPAKKPGKTGTFDDILNE